MLSFIIKVQKLENFVTILKTVNCTIHASLKEKLSELELLYGQYDVHTLCEALEVSRGTFYNHILRNKRSDAWFETQGFRFGKSGRLQLKFELFDILCPILFLKDEHSKSLALQGF